MFPAMSNDNNTPTFIQLANGRITCLQCQAKSKRSGQQCRAPASKGKAVCRFHGALSTGPKSPDGRARCTAAKTTHGTETRALRRELTAGMRRLRDLEEIGRAIGLLRGLQSPKRHPQG